MSQNLGIVYDGEIPEETLYSVALLTAMFDDLAVLHALGENVGGIGNQSYGIPYKYMTLQEFVEASQICELIMADRERDLTDSEIQALSEVFPDYDFS